VHLKNEKLLIGTSTYFIIICSKGIVRKIEYPVLVHYDSNKDWRDQNVYWQSDYLDMLIEQMKKTAGIK
jgi:hypothetical protein